MKPRIKRIIRIMTLRNDEYRIEDDGIWISKQVLEQFRDHYNGVADKQKRKFVKGEDNFRYPFYLGKAEVCTDLLKMFEPLEG